MKKRISGIIGILTAVFVLTASIIPCGNIFPFGIREASAADIAASNLTLSGVNITCTDTAFSDPNATVTSDGVLPTTYQKFTASFGSVKVSDSLGYDLYTTTNLDTDGTFKGHPRLFVKDHSFQSVLDSINNNYMARKMYEGVKATADSYVDGYSVDESGNYIWKTAFRKYAYNSRANILEAARNSEYDLFMLALVYNIEKLKAQAGDPGAVLDYAKYLHRAIGVAENAATYTNWSTNAFLCTAELTAGVAVAYDWLYQDLTNDQRYILVSTAYEKGIVPFLYNYTPGNTAKGGTNFADTAINWNPVCNSCAIVAGISFMSTYINTTDKTYSQGISAPMSGISISTNNAICTYLVERGAECLYKGLTEFADGGYYREGVMYWLYASKFLSLGIDAYESAAKDVSVLSDRFKHAEQPGISVTADFPIYTNGIVGGFNFGDAGADLQYGASLYWYAKRFDKIGYKDYIDNLLGLYNKSLTSMNAVMALFWYDKDWKINISGVDNVPLDTAHSSDSNVNILSMRSSYNVSNSHRSNAFVAMQGGKNGENHMGLSLGTFVLDMNGKRFVKQCGAGNYSWKSYTGKTYNGVISEKGSRYQYYKMRAEGNNTIIANPETELGGQNAQALAQIVKSNINGKYAAYGILDMTQTNAAFADAKRGIMLCDNRSRVIVQDEVEFNTKANGALSKNSLYWYAHTGDNEVVPVKSGDWSKVRMTAGDVTITAEITNCTVNGVKKNASFVYDTVSNLHFSDPLARDLSDETSALEGLGSKLQIVVDNIAPSDKVSLTVEFAPESKSAPVTVRELSDWDSAIAAEKEPVPDRENYLSKASYYDTTWYSPSANKYYIYDDKALAGLSKLVNDGTSDFSGKTVYLMTDTINMRSDIDWVPIGTNEHPFKGTFYGAQRTINGLTLSAFGNDAGLFGMIDGGIIDRLTLTDANINGSENVGCVCGHMTGSSVIRNINVLDSEAIANSRSGGIVGAVENEASVKNCAFYGSAIANSSMHGGIAGYSAGVINNCNTFAKLTDSVSAPYAGGVLGFSAYGTTSECYYYYTSTIMPTGTKPVNEDSYDLSYANGKVSSSNKIGNISSGIAAGVTLKYGGQKTDAASKAWVADQTDKDLYLSTWKLIDETYYSYGQTVDARVYLALLEMTPEQIIDDSLPPMCCTYESVTADGGKIEYVVSNSGKAGNVISVIIGRKDGKVVVNRFIETAVPKYGKSDKVSVDISGVGDLDSITILPVRTIASMYPCGTDFYSEL